jgi:hypothetical protein
VIDPDTLADTLSWTGGNVEVDRLDAALVAASREALRPRAGAVAADAVEALAPPARERVLRAPEVTRRLLFPRRAPGRGPSDDTAQFVAEAACVEAALDGTGPAPASLGWSALGDAVVRPDGTGQRWPQVDGAPPLDFGSPWAQHVDLSGRREFAPTPRRPFTAGEVLAVHAGVEAAFAGLAVVSPAVVAFVVRATCVLILQPNADAPHQVASGTNGAYVGRSFVTNPQLPDATPACLAESVVHEAIHGLLYRDALGRPWVVGEPADETPRLSSPWTGRPLPVRAYLEAACVWFGLVHLWALASRAEGHVLPAGVVRQRLLRAVRGFGEGSLVDRARPWWPAIRPDVLNTVDTLQERMVGALVGAV